MGLPFLAWVLLLEFAMTRVAEDKDLGPFLVAEDQVPCSEVGRRIPRLKSGLKGSCPESCQALVVGC